jgi:hypothetical protein
VLQRALLSLVVVDLLDHRRRRPETSEQRERRRETTTLFLRLALAENCILAFSDRPSPMICFFAEKCREAEAECVAIIVFA